MKYFGWFLFILNIAIAFSIFFTGNIFVIINWFLLGIWLQEWLTYGTLSILEAGKR